MKSVGLCALAAAASLCSGAGARAAVVYAFQGPGGISTYLSSGFITADTGPQAFSGCANQNGFVCQSVSFDVAPSASGAFDQAGLRIVDTSNGSASTLNYKFAPGAFATQGIHWINPAASMAVLDVGAYAPGSVLYLLLTPNGWNGAISHGYGAIGGERLPSRACSTSPPAACGLIGFSSFLRNGELFDIVSEGSGATSIGQLFAPGTIQSPGIHEGAFAGRYLAVVPLPDLPQGGVPEPETWALAVMGFGALGQMLRRRARRSRPSL